MLITDARILTLARGEMPRRGAALRDLGVIERGWLRVEGDRIAEIGAGSPPSDPNSQTAKQSNSHIRAGGRVLMPAFVDCHTHACWAGERFDEFEMKLAGASYLEILEAGGGIMSTVRAVRAAGAAALTDRLLVNLGRMAALGTGTVEVKSGYGLRTDAELKMLRAIDAARPRTALSLTPTFLGAHAIDRDNPRFVEETIHETLPAAAAAFPGITCDAYCEQGAWSREDTTRLFRAALDLGCPIRVHVDQFNALGMTRVAVEMGTRSVDHLEALAPADLEFLAGSATIAVALPCSGFHLDDRYAPARALVDAGAALAIATNCNPGSAPTASMPFAIALAARKLRLTPAEAISACTVNAACVLGAEAEVGSLAPGRRADLQLLDGADERELAYEIAPPGPLITMVGGRIVHDRRPQPGG